MPPAWRRSSRRSLRQRCGSTLTASFFLAAHRARTKLGSSFCGLSLSSAQVRSYLTGVVIGPHWSIPTTKILQEMPKGFAVRQYPDICHSRSAQYAIPDWHWAWQFTHGRQVRLAKRGLLIVLWFVSMTCRALGCLQVVNPMPRMMESIVRLRGNGSTPTIGVGAYSEGANDDLNKAVWSGIAANPNTTIEDLVAQYARYHFGAELEESMTALLFGLEQNWVGGDIATNTHILSTISLATSVLQQANSTGSLQTNWRMQMYLYRAYYDAYVQARFQSQTQCVQQAKEILAQMSQSGSRAAIDRARKALLSVGGAQGDSDEPAALKQTCLSLFDAMNKSVGVEVIQGQVTSMNIDKIDETTSDVGFMLAELERFEQMGTEAERVHAIHVLLTWEDPGVGGFYDNLAPRSARGALYGHLNPGQGPKADPGAPHPNV